MKHAHPRAMGGAAILAAALLTALSLASCRTAREATATLRADTVRLVTVARDSTLLRDSIYIMESRAGDTVFLTKTVTRLRYRDRLVRDTVYRARTDTLYKERTKEVEKVKAALRWKYVAVAIFSLVVIAIGAGWIYRLTNKK